jgi:two-component system, NarL family, response regulator NreC
MKISVLLADDNKLFRELLTHRFAETEEIEVVGEAEESVHLLNLAKEVQPDIILMDIFLPRMKGIETAQLLGTELPKCKIIALTSHAEKTHIKGALNAGVFGYYHKNCSYEQLVFAIKQSKMGIKTVSADIEDIIINDYLGRNNPASTTLTKREAQILKLLAEGKSIREISETFFISIKTVGTHKQNIFDKMGFDNLAQLVMYAIKQGIVY